jgi:lipopolysaccharide heptosyltransferase II
MWRKSKFDPNSVRSILVSRLRFLGDVILTTPLLRNLRLHFPKATIAYLTEDAYAPVLENSPYLNVTYSLPRDASLGDQWRLITELRRQRFDLAIDLLGIPRSAVLLRLSGAKVRVGGNFRGRRLLYTHRIKDDGNRRSAVDFHLHALHVLGLEAQPFAPQVHVSPEDRAWARGYLIARGLNPDSPLVGLHPGASWPNKMWMWDRFAALAERVVADGGQVIITQGPGEEVLARQVLERSPRGVVLSEPLSLCRLAALLQQLDVYVSNDAGVMHLAAAVGTKTVGIFGPGEADIWFPYSSTDGHQAVYKEIWCRPCHKNFCPLGTLECMKIVEVDDVYGAVLLAYDTDLTRGNIVAR